MEIVEFEDRYSDGVIEIWNKSCENEMPYKPFTKESFQKTFLANPEFDYKGTFVALENDKVIGFANGIFPRKLMPGESAENAPGYVTFVIVDQQFRGKGIGAQLLSRVEKFFMDSGKHFAAILFFNPISLSWYIPGTDGHDHPCSPGVDLGSEAFPFFIRHGYFLTTAENSMHLDLTNYEIPQKTAKKIESLKKDGITFEYYDSKKHTGLDEFFDHLGNEYWRKDINDNMRRENPRPVIIACDKGKVCGFTGPVDKEESGRGWFAGIGVDPAYEGKGIGTVLFTLLMKNFKEIGVKFSSLYTGIENPARKIYLRTGFQVVKQWGIMRKELQ